MVTERVLIYHISEIATPAGDHARHGREMRMISIVKDAAIYIEDGIIREAGTEKDVIEAVKSLQLKPGSGSVKNSGAGTEESGSEDCGKAASGFLRNLSEYGITGIDAQGHAVVPGFVDSHTHFIFAGYRPEEFIRRLQGATYMEIMKMGGGIRNTVTATRAASEEELFTLGKARVAEMLSQGITTAEGKSGYGLDLETELRMLHVMERLRRELPIDLGITYLGAHAVADEFAGDSDGYVDYMISTVMPKVREETEAEFCDVFCEEGVFSAEQSKRILEAAKGMGFALKLHADEIVSTKGAELAAEEGCVSADHLLAASPGGIRDLAKSDTIATLLPCTAFCLGAKYADARKMIDAGCAVALASDYNPGSCFTQSVPLMAALGAIQMHMTPEEVLCALTLNGAAALGRADRTGSVEKGKRADLNILAYDDYRFLIYKTGMNVVDTVLKDGRVVYTARQ